jgi:DNA-binding IclR family transcriptional regulator
MAAQRKGIQSVEQGVKLQETLIASRKSLPLRTLAQTSGMSPSMAHRYLTSFIRAGLVQQESDSGHYDLGTFALRIGMAALNRADFIRIADDEFRGLVARVNVDGHLSIWGDYGVTIVRIYNSQAPLLSDLRLGAVLPLYDSAAGRLFLAHQPPSQIKPILKAELAKREQNKPSAKEVSTAAADAHRDGFAWIDGQVFHGIRAIAAPIFDPQGELRAAMSLVSNQPSLVELPNAIVDDLRSTANSISQRIGWQGHLTQ